MPKKYSKRYKKISRYVTDKKVYEVNQALELAKKTSNVKFDASIEMIMRLNVDPRHADQQIRGAIVLPEGTGKSQKVLVLTTTSVNEAIEADADFVGGQDLIDKIAQKNWFDFDVIIATPDIMPKLAKIGKILGPKGLMPSLKTETITTNVKKAVNDIKKGKLVYRTDKNGNVHLVLGKASFTLEQLENNYKAIYAIISRLRPAAVKGNFIKSMFISSTMGPSIKIATTV